MGNWQTQRKRELWAAAIGPASLLAGMWGLVFHIDGAVISGMAGIFAADQLAPMNWIGRAMGAGMFAIWVGVGTLIPPDIGLSETGRLAAVLFAVEGLLHVSNCQGNAHRLMEKLCESGEFQQDVADVRGQK